MKVLLVSAANSLHSIRWANSLFEKGLEVHLFSVHEIDCDNVPFNDGVILHIFSAATPWGYIKKASELKKVIKKIKPDIVNAHYATGYGLMSVLAKSKPLLLSVWGSDVYDFPRKSFLHFRLLRWILKRATAIASTSHVMAAQTKKIYSHSEIFVTPFGVDTGVFYPFNVKVSGCINIGIVKVLEDKYGIDTLIKAFAICLKSTEKPLRLFIAGRGSKEAELRALCDNLGIADRVVFVGFIKNNKVPELLNQLDVFVALSDSESFGVAAVEASACGKPVVVSDADGLTEVVEDSETGFIVPKRNPDAAAKRILELVNDPKKREKMGARGRLHVESWYSWEKSLATMIDAYKETIAQQGKR